MRHSSFLLSAWVMVSTVSAQSLRISGTITDFAGAPIANAQVSLSSGGLKANSDAQGRFSLSGGANGLRGKPSLNPHAGKVQNGFLNLDLMQDSRLNVTVFSALGERLASQNGAQESGKLALPLGGQPGFSIYRLSLHADGNAQESTLKGLTKASATSAAFYDVMKVTANGYNKYEGILVGTEAGLDTSGLKIVLLKEGDLPRFSFFVTSLEAMRALSGSQNGFGGDLRYGQTGAGAGLRGADKICADVAERGLKGSSAKQWRAFLSVSDAGNGVKQDAIDRIGPGPWYDRLGRVVADSLAGLLGGDRPAGDAVIASDLPNETGEPNHGAGGVTLDNHDVLTGSDKTGRLHASPNCENWTTTTTATTGGGTGSMGKGPMAGHSWPANSGKNWLQAHGVAGCAPSVVTGQGSFGGSGVGDGGGYGGIYCFALVP